MPNDFTWDDAKPTGSSSGFTWESAPPQWTAANQAIAEKAAADAKANNYGQPQAESGWQRLAEGAESGAKAMLPSLPSSASDYARMIGSTLPGIGLVEKANDIRNTFNRERQSGQGVLPSIGSAIGSQVGLDTQGIKERAQKGDVAGVVGEGVPAIATALLPEVKEAGGAARERIGGAIHTPEGELTPLARNAGRAGAFAAGAGIGHAVGLPGIGDWITGHVAENVGPNAMEKLFPEPAAAKNARAVNEAGESLAKEQRNAPKPEPELGSPENPGWVVNLPNHMPTRTAGPVPGETFNAVPARGTRIPTMQDLGRLIEQEGAGTKPLQRNVPIGQQVPAKFPEVGQVPLGNRVALDVRDLGEQRVNAPEKMPTIPQEEVGRNMGAPPLQPNRPLREQFKPDAEAMAHQSEQSRLEEKYPDKAMRQMVHANGEEMVDAIGDDADTLRAIHDLRNPDVRQAMINAGEDMGQKTVSNRKAMGEGSISRQDAFRQLLKKGYTPQQIIEMAQPPEEVGAGKPGPQRATEWRKLEREAGD